MLIIRMTVLAVFLFLVPALLGAPWTEVLPNRNRYRMSACFPIGFFVELAIFQLIEVPFAFLHLPFTLLCWLFAIIVMMACIYSGVYFRKNRPFAIRLSRLNSWEILYLIVFVGLLILQLYNSYVSDTTVWSYDDAAYITYAEDTIRTNRIMSIDPYTGIATRFDINRGLQGWLYFPAFLSNISMLSVAMMERTLLETYDVVLGYTVYTYMASVLFSKMEDGLIFLIVLSILHIFGLYSPYSITFRLLGPNYQGKAVLAASLCPLLYTVLAQAINMKYDLRTGILIALFSICAVSLTLFGGVVIILSISIVTVLSLLRKKRRWKHLLYIPWGVTMPVVYVGIFLIHRFFRW